MTFDPYEVVFAVISLVSAGGSLVLFLAKMADVVRVLGSGTNGATAFNTIDKARRQGVLLAIVVIFLYMAVTGLNNQEPLTTQTRNLLSGLLIAQVLLLLDTAFTYRKRRKLPSLIAEEERRSTTTVRPGGRRATDPPL